MDVKEEAILGPGIKDHWYYLSKGRALRKILGGEPVEEVLDVGAGRADLRVLRGRYFFGALFPLVAAIRMRDRVQLRAGKIEAKSQLKLASSMVNSALVRIHDVERVSLFSINRLAGLTAFCLAVRDPYCGGRSVALPPNMREHEA